MWIEYNNVTEIFWLWLQVFYPRIELSQTFCLCLGDKKQDFTQLARSSLCVFVLSFNALANSRNSIFFHSLLIIKIERNAKKKKNCANFRISSFKEVKKIFVLFLCIFLSTCIYLMACCCFLLIWSTTVRNK